MLLKRYANPYFFIDQVIETHRFCEFIESLVDAYNEEIMYEYWLHKIYGQSFADFKQSVSSQNNDDADLETTIEESQKILSNFIPKEER